MDAFTIVIPVFVGQLMVIFQWFGAATDMNSDLVVGLPTWVVKGPPLAITAILVVTVLAMGLGNFYGLKSTPSPEVFKGIVTFSVSILNATTVFIVSRYFQAAKPGQQPSDPASR